MADNPLPSSTPSHLGDLSRRATMSRYDASSSFPPTVNAHICGNPTSTEARPYEKTQTVFTSTRSKRSSMLMENGEEEEIWKEMKKYRALSEHMKNIVDDHIPAQSHSAANTKPDQSSSHLEDSSTSNQYLYQHRPLSMITPTSPSPITHSSTNTFRNLFTPTTAGGQNQIEGVFDLNSHAKLQRPEFNGDFRPQHDPLTSNSTSSSVRPVGSQHQLIPTLATFTPHSHPKGSGSNMRTRVSVPHRQLLRGTSSRSTHATLPFALPSFGIHLPPLQSLVSTPVHPAQNGISTASLRPSITSLPNAFTPAPPSLARSSAPATTINTAIFTHGHQDAHGPNPSDDRPVGSIKPGDVQIHSVDSATLDELRIQADEAKALLAEVMANNREFHQATEYLQHQIAYLSDQLTLSHAIIAQHERDKRVMVAAEDGDGDNDELKAFVAELGKKGLVDRRKAKWLGEMNQKLLTVTNEREHLTSELKRSESLWVEHQKNLEREEYLQKRLTDLQSQYDTAQMENERKDTILTLFKSEQFAEDYLHPELKSTLEEIRAVKTKEDLEKAVLDFKGKIEKMTRSWAWHMIERRTTALDKVMMTREIRELRKEIAHMSGK
ncbi:hypothetical protein IAR55_006397 [Kwoniella newhampshirensis]|uniref:Uncharacterized protein n=1 Tax=Kwoniella newhampshirensis TaxID=1651941 RepID=A0AAW0YTQ1_9TREE